MFLNRGTVLRVILDGKERLLIGAMKRQSGDVLSGGRVTEQLTMQVPFSVIERLSRATKLEMQIGLEEFELTPQQIADLREWVKRFPSEQSKLKS